MKNVSKVIVNQNTVKLPKYTEKMTLYIHIKIKRNIFPQGQHKER